MRCVSLYDRSTGLITGHMTSSDERNLDINVPPTHNIIDGHHAPDRFRVDLDTKEVVEHAGARDPAPSFDSEMQDARLIRHLDIESIALLRDYALGKTGSFKRLQEIDGEIAEIRKQLSKG